LLSLKFTYSLRTALVRTNAILNSSIALELSVEHRFSDTLIYTLVHVQKKIPRTADSYWVHTAFEHFQWSTGYSQLYLTSKPIFRDTTFLFKIAYFFSVICNGWKFDKLNSEVSSETIKHSLDWIHCKCYYLVTRMAFNWLR